MTEVGFLDRVTGLLGRIGAVPEESDEERLRRTLLIGASLMFVLAGLCWGGVYIAFDEPLAGAVPISYALVSTLSILLLGLTRRYRPYRFTQLLLILCLPFALQVALGGFVSSSAAVLWSLICPLGALLFGGRQEAVGWFAAFLALLVAGALVQPDTRIVNHLPPWLILGFFVANIGAVSAIAFVLLHHFVGQERRFFGLLRREREKSERLLENILPKEIADVLKDGKVTVATAYDSVSILFADIVGFTALSDELSPGETVELLNELFSHFDRLVERHGLEKIRTIGDSYMVVSGAPRPRPDHAQALARLALEIRDHVDGYRYHGRRLRFRMGIASGPVVAGVIGRRKFHYDVWGDTANMASRMESLGEAGKIQVTRETYELIEDEFDCEPRGTVAVKGKGERETWYLLGARDAHG